MPPRKRAAQTLSAHIDSSSDDEAVIEEAKVVSVSQKKATGRRATATRKAPITAAEKKPAARGKRKAAATEDEEEIDDPAKDDGALDDIVIVVDEGKKKGGKAPTKPKKEPTKRARGRKTATEEPEPEEDGEQPESIQEEIADGTTKRGKKTAAEPAAPAPEKKKRMSKKDKEAADKETVEAQFLPMELDPPSSKETDNDQELEIAPTPTEVHQAGTRKGSGGKGAVVKGKGKGMKSGHEIDTEEDDLSQVPIKVVIPGRGKGKSQISAGDEKALRDLQEAYEELQSRYDKLQEAKESEPERALKEFRKNMKEKDEERNKVISNLQAELKAQQALFGESRAVQKKLIAKEAEVSKLQEKVQELSKSLHDQQNENQVISAKLAQAQHQIAQAQTQKNNAQAPGSAVKSGYRGPLGAPKANLNMAADDAKLKEDLYADLCGLIIVNVKKDNECNVFECLQTGVDGLAIHFKLSVPTQSTKSKKASNHEGKNSGDIDEIDDDEVLFIPLIDQVRDKSVIEILPTYLRGEISFQKDHMTKFYQKINSLFMMSISTRKPQSDSTEEESDDEEEEDEEDENETEEDDEDGDEKMEEAK
ncbi:chromosome segregation protein Csm1/Pcs1-domain-containing protein [Morchella snyderi]|nr:chromosome segregation protein Csm1/Pcs1-domain-containing protein [Morchella snyderi]